MLRTLAADSYIAQFVDAPCGSDGNQESVSVYATCMGALDGVGPGLAG